MKKRVDLTPLVAGLSKPDAAGPAMVRAFEEWLIGKARHPRMGDGPRCDFCGLRPEHAIHLILVHRPLRRRGARRPEPAHGR